MAIPRSVYYADSLSADSKRKQQLALRLLILTDNAVTMVLLGTRVDKLAELPLQQANHYLVQSSYIHNRVLKLLMNSHKMQTSQYNIL